MSDFLEATIPISYGADKTYCIYRNGSTKVDVVKCSTRTELSKYDGWAHAFAVCGFFYGKHPVARFNEHNILKTLSNCISEQMFLLANDIDSINNSTAMFDTLADSLVGWLESGGIACNTVPGDQIVLNGVEHRWPIFAVEIRESRGTDKQWIGMDPFYRYRELVHSRELHLTEAPIFYWCDPLANNIQWVSDIHSALGG